MVVWCQAHTYRRKEEKKEGGGGHWGCGLIGWLAKAHARTRPRLADLNSHSTAGVMMTRALGWCAWPWPWLGRACVFASGRPSHRRLADGRCALLFDCLFLTVTCPRPPLHGLVHPPPARPACDGTLASSLAGRPGVLWILSPLFQVERRMVRMVRKKGPSSFVLLPVCCAAAAAHQHPPQGTCTTLPPRPYICRFGREGALGGQSRGVVAPGHLQSLVVSFRAPPLLLHSPLHPPTHPPYPPTQQQHPKECLITAVLPPTRVSPSLAAAAAAAVTESARARPTSTTWSRSR